MDYFVEIVSRNLATKSNFVSSEVVGISRFSRRGVSDDTWQGKEMPYGTIRE